jgi:hypothetical protein
MIRIAISPQAFEAAAASLPHGSVAYEAELTARGERLIWVEATAVDRLADLRGESYSDVAKEIYVRRPPAPDSSATTFKLDKLLPRGTSPR